MLKFIPIGGIGGVTKNMYVYEIYSDDKLKDIVIVDCGIGFPKEKELGQMIMQERRQLVSDLEPLMEGLTQTAVFVGESLRELR